MLPTSCELFLKKQVGHVSDLGNIGFPDTKPSARESVSNTAHVVCAPLMKPF